MRGPLFGFAVALVATLVILGLVLAVDITLRVIEDANQRIAGTLEVEPSKEFSEQADRALAPIPYVLAASVLFAIVVYGAHRSKR